MKPQAEVVDALNDTEAQRYELAMPVAGSRNLMGRLEMDWNGQKMFAKNI